MDTLQKTTTILSTDYRLRNSYSNTTNTLTCIAKSDYWNILAWLEEYK